MKMRRDGIPIHVMMAAVLLIIYGIAGINQDAGAVITLPNVTVQLAEERYDVDVDPGSSGIVEVNGTVRMAGIWPEGYDDFIVDITADAGGWQVDVPDATITLTRDHASENFSVALHVPLETSTIVPGSISVSGSWYSESADESGNVIPDSADVHANHYYRYAIGSDDGTGIVEIENEIEFDCRLINEGNGDDRIGLEILNSENLTENGIKITISQNKFMVPEKQEKHFVVVAEASNETPLGNYTIFLRAVSEQAEGLGEPAGVYDLELRLEVLMNESEPVVEREVDKAPFLEPFHIIMIGALFSLLYFISDRRPVRR